LYGGPNWAVAGWRPARRHLPDGAAVPPVVLPPAEPVDLTTLRFRLDSAGRLYVHDPSATCLPRGAEWRRVLPRLEADWVSPYRLCPEQVEGWVELQLHPVGGGGASC
jgi:hypothetical protein